MALGNRLKNVLKNNQVRSVYVFVFSKGKWIAKNWTFLNVVRWPGNRDYGHTDWKMRTQADFSSKVLLKIYYMLEIK